LLSSLLARERYRSARAAITSIKNLPVNRYRHHVFVCTNTRPPFAKPSCGLKEGNQVVTLLREQIEQHGMQETVRITACGCLGPCEQGTIMVVYPQGIWYKGVTSSDIAEIVSSHILRNSPVTRLQFQWPESDS
jgi:(2Fe-2S) ferredoxin